MPPLVHLERSFPKLVAAGYQKTSDKTNGPLSPGTYNCIAWAAEDIIHGYWWPSPNGTWPRCITREVTVPCFVKAFRCLGYARCKHSRHEFAYHKVVLYAIHNSRGPKPVPSRLQDFEDWTPTHMARQLPDGTWTSKCGGNEDIRHLTLDALESYGFRQDAYGCPVLYMKRPIPISLLVQFIRRIAWKIQSFWKQP